MSDISDRLAGYPWVVVRISCQICPRRGAYRLARLAAKLGPETSLNQVVERVTFDCPHRSSVPRRRERKYVPNCKAYLPDLIGPRPPPDLPPGAGGLRVIDGGRTDKPMLPKPDAAE